MREKLREALSTIELLQAENEALRDMVSRLEALLKADSSTTGKPPSSDPIGPRKKRAERRAEARAEKRSRGKQPGAPGANLQRREPDAVAEHAPACCRSCGADLAGAEVVGKQVRQVIDLPPVVPIVTDHVSYRLRCACGAETVGGFPPEAKAPVCFGPEVRAFATYLLDRQHLPVERTAELLADLLGVKVSTGWLCAVQAEAAGRLTPFLAWLRDRLQKEPVVHADETGTAVGTTKHWAHTLTTKLLTPIAVHPKRGLEALNDIGVLAVYTGTVVHDGYASYDLFTAATHAQCNAHALRHLKSVGEAEAFSAWADQMTGILMDAKVAAEAAASAGPVAASTPAGRASSGPVTKAPSTRSSPCSQSGHHRPGQPAPAGARPSARPGTWPPACVLTLSSSCAAWTTPAWPGTTMLPNEPSGW